MSVLLLWAVLLTPTVSHSGIGVGRSSVAGAILHNCREALETGNSPLVSDPALAMGMFQDLRFQRLKGTGNQTGIEAVRVGVLESELGDSARKTEIADRIRGLEAHHRLSEKDEGLVFEGHILRGKEAIERWQSRMTFIVDELESGVSDSRLWRLVMPILALNFPFWYFLLGFTQGFESVEAIRYPVALATLLVGILTGPEYWWKHFQTMDFGFRRHLRRVDEFLAWDPKQNSSPPLLYVGTTEVIPSAATEKLSREDFSPWTSHHFKEGVRGYGRELTRTRGQRWFDAAVEWLRKGAVERLKRESAEQTIAEVQRSIEEADLPEEWGPPPPPPTVDALVANGPGLSLNRHYPTEWVLIDQMFRWVGGEPVLAIVTRRSDREPLRFRPNGKPLTWLERLRESLERARQRALEGVEAEPEPLGSPGLPGG